MREVVLVFGLVSFTVSILLVLMLAISALANKSRKPR
jgi:hypothetical protein